MLSRGPGKDSRSFLMRAQYPLVRAVATVVTVGTTSTVPYMLNNGY